MRLDDDELEVLRLGALLHDIGKIGVSDAVLRKPGALTRRGVRADQAAPGARRPHPAQRALPRTAPAHRRTAPRAAGREGLSARPDGRRDSAARPHRPRRRRVRRDDERARLPSGARVGRRAAPSSGDAPARSSTPKSCRRWPRALPHISAQPAVTEPDAAAASLRRMALVGRS